MAMFMYLHRRKLIMFILNPPYISELLVNTIKKNKYKTLKNSAAENLGINEVLIDDKQAVDYAENHQNFKLYTNSENSIEWIMNNLKSADIPEKVTLFKDKAKFRDLLKNIYPDFYYKEILYEDLEKLNTEELKFPFVLKPAIGFLSLGVYPIRTKEEFNTAINKLSSDIQNFKDIFPKEVVNSSRFLIEQMAEGDEFAIDAYYNSKGEAVILNIFHHPFLDENDVSDRVYYTSKKVIKDNLDRFNELLEKIGEAADLKNFPMHIELRADGNNIIPIEVNPMRFAGWCDTDLAYWAYGINVYEYYMNDKKPDWKNILDNKGDELYYFLSAEVPSSLDKNKIKSVNYDKFIACLESPLEIRKTDYKTKPLFAIVFGKSKNINEINKILKMDLGEFIEI